MTANIYDLNSPFVTPTAPAATAATPTATRAPDRLMRAGAYLLTFAGLLLLAALVVAVTPLGKIDADITMPFVTAVFGVMGAIVWAVLR